MRVREGQKYSVGCQQSAVGTAGPWGPGYRVRGTAPIRSAHAVSLTCGALWEVLGLGREPRTRVGGKMANSWAPDFATKGAHEKDEG